eukprot:GILI01022422.1.p1 GENE.GILI01022422.1~~GILI01022422.1.p1  ORF type:complete len:336 (+),score=18.80 GILI01022422.1:94-1101(+)
MASSSGPPNSSSLPMTQSQGPGEPEFSGNPSMRNHLSGLNRSSDGEFTPLDNLRLRPILYDDDYENASSGPLKFSTSPSTDSIPLPPLPAILPPPPRPASFDFVLPKISSFLFPSSSSSPLSSSSFPSFSFAGPFSSSSPSSSSSSSIIQSPSLYHPYRSTQPSHVRDVSFFPVANSIKDPYPALCECSRADCPNCGPAMLEDEEEASDCAESPDVLANVNSAASAQGKVPTMARPLRPPYPVNAQELLRNMSPQDILRGHKQDKPHACDFPGCTARFANQAGLRVHYRSHVNFRPFVCMVCDRSFTRSSNAHQHVRMVHKLESSSGYVRNLQKR